MARTYLINDGEHHHDPKGLLRTLPPVDEDFPLLHLPQAAMATHGVLPAIRVGERTHKSHVSHFANPINLGISEGVTLYNKKAEKAGQDLKRADVHTVAAAISIGAGIKAPTSFVRPLRRFFHRNVENPTLGPTDKQHKLANTMLENAGVPYYRFDPPRLPNCELYDWGEKTRNEIERLTRSYLEEPRVSMQLVQLARWLIAIKTVRAKCSTEQLYKPRPAFELGTRPAIQPRYELGVQDPGSLDSRTSNRTQTWPRRSSNVLSGQDPSREHGDATSPARRHTEHR